MVNLTIFTLDLNNHICNPLQKLCIDSWYRCKEYLCEKDINIDIKIFNENDSEYGQFYNKFSYILNLTEHLSHKADLFRLYILSKYINYCWLDTDVYIYDANNFIDTFKNFIFKKYFYALSSGDNTTFFKSVLNYYLDNNELIKLCDHELVEKLNIQCSNFNAQTSGVVHLRYIDHYTMQNKVPTYIYPDEYNKEVLIQEMSDLKEGKINKQQIREKRLLIYRYDCNEILDKVAGKQIPKDKYLIDFLHSIGINL